MQERREMCWVRRRLTTVFTALLAAILGKGSLFLLLMAVLLFAPPATRVMQLQITVLLLANPALRVHIQRLILRVAYHVRRENLMGVQVIAQPPASIAPKASMCN